MNYRVITPPAAEPISLDDAREHLRIEPFGSPPEHPDDAYVSSLISVARQFCEEYLERSLATQTIELAKDSFTDPIDLQNLPVQSVQSITYVDIDGVTQTLSDSVYALDTFKGVVRLKYGQQFPATRNQANAVIVTYTAGYTNGESPDTYPLPAPIRSAMMLIIGNFYENRQQDLLGNTRISFNSLPLGVYNLLQPYRLGMGM